MFNLRAHLKQKISKDTANPFIKDIERTKETVHIKQVPIKRGFDCIWCPHLVVT